MTKITHAHGADPTVTLRAAIGANAPASASPSVGMTRWFAAQA